MQENLPIIPTLTCGLIIRSPSGWLLAHRTGSAWWDLPKGKQDPGEDPLQTALRECFEETGLDLSSYRLRCQDLGCALYNPARQKSLQLYLLDLPVPPSLQEFRCSSFVLRAGHPVPEMDQVAWVAEHRIRDYLRPRLFRHLLARQILSASRVRTG